MFSFSTDAFSADNTGSRLQWLLQLIYPALSTTQYEWIHFLIRKAAHVTEYGLLALLWLRAFRHTANKQQPSNQWQWRIALQVFAIIALWALLDEWHQSFTANRTASFYDSLLDMSGGLMALLAAWGVSKWRAV